MLSKTSEIESLYREFEQLKGKIYGKSGWQQESHKRRAQQRLRESTISQYQRDFQRDIQIIQMSDKKAQDRRSRRKEKQPQQVEDQLDTARGQLFSDVQTPALFSQQFEHYERSPSLSVERSVYEQGEQRFRQIINHTIRPPQQQSQPERLDRPSPQQTLGPMFAEVMNQHMEQLGAILETVTFLQRKVHCLQLIIEQTAKVSRCKHQNTATLPDLRRIEAVYEEEIDNMRSFYENKLAEREEEHQNSLKQTAKSLSQISSAKGDAGKLEDLLREARKLLKTKQELISNLSDENTTLRGELQKYKKIAIMNSGGSSLRYSGDKINEVHYQVHQPQPGNYNSKEWEEFGNDDDIDYSDLDSIRDQSMSDFDISKLQKSRKKSHSKTIQGLYDELSASERTSP